MQVGRPRVVCHLTPPDSCLVVDRASVWAEPQGRFLCVSRRSSLHLASSLEQEVNVLLSS